MSKRNLILLLTLAWPLINSSAQKTDTPMVLFTAMMMTKAQQASSVPTDSGVLLRDKSTGEWLRFGPAIQMISSATADPSDPDTIFLACGNGIVRSQDGGESWRLVTGWRESDVLQIAVDPEDGNRVYAASAWGVTLSTDGGDTWQASNTGLPEYFSKNIAIDYRKTSRLLLATGTGLFESRNRGKTWKRITSFPQVAGLRLRRSESDPDLWICGSEGRGVWVSTDDGKTWKATAPALKEANIYGVAIDPFEADNLAAGGWGTGVYLTEDRGKSWEKARGKLPSDNITSVLFDVNVSHRIWASTFEEGTYFSDDFGNSWTTAELDGAYVQDLGFLPQN
ncbi:MAG: hypothetical protein KJT03_03910 [Verrucomicrobiae bacterium]|nr:hypothetical protein [Verrucomicrobiae bacterium]